MTDSELNPILCLWCHPRSMSTAMERVMRERGDFTCFHEPFMYDYYVHRQIDKMPYFDIDPDAPASYEDIKSMLLEQARLTPVFIKDMSYYIVPQLFSDLSFARRLTHTFLIRNPLHSILSYYKLDHNLTLEEIGLEAQYRHVMWLRNELSIEPVVLVAEEVRKDAQKSITDYWQKIGLEIRPQAFEWSKTHTPDDWQQVATWHGNVSQSQGIRKPSKENDLKREHEFNQLAVSAPYLKELLDHHLPFYDKLKAYSQQHQ